MNDPLVIVSLVFGAAGFLLGVVEFRRREKLLARIRPWERHARTIAAMGEEHLRNADNLRSRTDEAERTVSEMAASARGLSEAMRRAGAEFQAQGVDSAEPSEPRRA